MFPGRHHWRPDDVDDTRADASEECVATLEDIDETRYRSIDDVTDADIDVFVAAARTPWRRAGAVSRTTEGAAPGVSAGRS
ncbi:hypothetical protein [Actinacidiphila sp. bgisy167]|uniref:hypothetical protein n=1 Tax=Actinacidiphila sp. bgisy167 TaxID=3413797 RepID=UPI003D750319